MQVTLGNVGVILSIVGVILYAMRRIIQWLELVTKASLLVVRYLNKGEEIPSWLAEQYKKLNGNDYSSPQEQEELLGVSHRDKESSCAQR